MEDRCRNVVKPIDTENASRNTTPECAEEDKYLRAVLVWMLRGEAERQLHSP